MHVAKREIRDGRLIKCRHNLIGIYPDCLLSEYQLHRAFLQMWEEVRRGVPGMHYLPNTHRFIFFTC